MSMAAAAVALVGVMVLVDDHIAGRLGEVSSVLVADRLHIETITSIRRDARKAHVAMLLRWLAPRVEWVSRGDAVRAMTTEVLQGARSFASSPASLPDEEQPRAELLEVLGAWSAGVERALDAPDTAPSALELQKEIDAMDRQAERIMRLISVAAKANDEQVVALRRAQGQAQLTFAALTLALLAAAGLWRTRGVAKTRVLAAQRGQLEQEQMLKAQAEFFARMSHELHTPVATIRCLAAEVMEQTPEHAAVYRSTAQIAKESLDLLTIINNILDAAKLESGEMELLLEDVDLRAVIERSVSRCTPLRNERPIELRTELVEKLPRVRGDFVKLQQILVNLIANAIKFTSDGSVTIRASSPAGHEILVEVTDTGAGIASDALQRIWKPFRQGEGGASREHGGTGLGLAIVRRLVALHGGTIEVESRVGEGTTFRLRLPAAAGVPSSSARNAAA